MPSSSSGRGSRPAAGVSGRLFAMGPQTPVKARERVIAVSKPQKPLLSPACALSGIHGAFTAHL
jgi:hypothetical protein